VSIFRAEHGLRVSGNELLRRTVLHKKGEVTGGCKILHNEEFYNLYSSPDIVRMKLAEYVTWGDKNSFITGTTALCWALASSSVS
jgi:hypothetical protein